MSAKPALRAAMRARRDDFFAGSPAAIDAPPPFVERLRAGLVVATYAPIASEADPARLVAAAVAAGCTLALPFVTSRAEPIRFVRWEHGAMLAAGPFGLLQTGPDALPAEPDIILTPLVAFDAALNRLGQGAGHYDRAFAQHPRAWRIGVAWSVQQVERLEADPWDVPLHAIVTEREWLTG